MEADTPRIEKYLESIFKLQQIQHPVTVSRLAVHLKLYIPSVSEMVKKLINKGLVSQTKKGIFLTEKGNSIAIKVIRRHRLSERLLTDILGFKWDEVHEKACKLEHAISPQVEERIAKILENPKTCPHGHPIPDKNGAITEEKVMLLSELKAYEEGIIVSVFEEDSKMLQYFSSLGLIPGTTVRLEEIAPLGSVFVVRVSGSRHDVGKEVASKIHIKK